MSYTELSTPEERERLDAEMSSCLAFCQDLTRRLEAAAAEVSSMEAGSHAQADAVAQRIGLLRQRMQAIHSRIASQSNAMESLVREVAEQGTALASSYAELSSSARERLDTLADKVQQLRQAVEQRSQAGGDAAVAATDELDTLLGDVSSGLKDCEKVVDEELRTHADQVIAAATASKEDLARRARDALEVVVAGGVEEHMRSASDSLSRKKQALQELMLRLKSVLSEVGASFGALEDATLGALGGALGETERSVSEAIENMKSITRDLTGTTTQVADALDTTQSGLRTVTDCLVRTKRVLEEIETL
jgi:ABC-type transporter Mla subunit MlaD